MYIDKYKTKKFDYTNFSASIFRFIMRHQKRKQKRHEVSIKHRDNSRRHKEKSIVQRHSKRLIKRRNLLPRKKRRRKDVAVAVDFFPNNFPTTVISNDSLFIL